MSEVVGLWIDHDEAVVVKLNGKDERVIKVASQVDAGPVIDQRSHRARG